jgi:hypothetical protein
MMLTTKTRLKYEMWKMIFDATRVLSIGNTLDDADDDVDEESSTRPATTTAGGKMASVCGKHLVGGFSAFKLPSLLIRLVSVLVCCCGTLHNIRPATIDGVYAHIMLVIHIHVFRVRAHIIIISF